MFPLLNIVKGDHHTAVLIADMMGQGSHDGRILEYSVFSEDDRIFKFFEHHGRAFNYHRNEPTTWGLGDVQTGRFRYHQRKILAVDLAGLNKNIILTKLINLAIIETWKSVGPIISFLKFSRSLPILKPDHLQ